ncbi:hypothetical protein SCL_0163 [Sulfuricaulis limicola]|uniref:Lipoprotein n=1 Tax=Sulfuricaulis limicola TaxID=1620215 RepID=A0A1B4XCC8_9GAMM|nr:hypothetical protein [Sulfuricaulis limicola]BAV32487.1 hypothetical protein SCL_0163 [Sulfuricaulis limicola]
MQLKIKGFSLVFVLMISGCLSSGPANNTGFGQIKRIEDLEGVYGNLGEASPGRGPFYLSKIIWPKDDELDHKNVENIEVRKITSEMLKVKAVTNGVVKKETTYVKGKDFDINGGRISLNVGGGIAGLKGGEPLVGPYYESAELGLDSTGHGKYRQSFATAGLVYLFLPIAIGGNEDVRFVRLEK